MTTTESFFERQSNLTAAKIEFYKKYLEGYLPKLLNQFGECLIADIFCGAGKNGDKDGSPLVLIDRCKYILKSPVFEESDCKISILFNDADKKNIENLKSEIEKIEDVDEIEMLLPENKNFEDLLPILIDKYRYQKVPKLFFLDPFSYSNVRMDDLKQLMSIPITEVLLFIPIFHSYRFASDISMREDHKTRRFIEEFTSKGVNDYENIYDYLQSVKEKILSETSLKYVRPILLEDGCKKNSLFFINYSPERYAFNEQDRF
jgi:three-Cys-motif partner protein